MECWGARFPRTGGGERLLGEGLLRCLAALEEFGQALDCLFFPRADLDRVNLIATGWFAGGLQPSDRFKRDLGFELGRMNPALLRHG
jgi:hypothetical protein